MTAKPPISALLAMKGHSERVPRKNLRPLAGRPLFFWIVDALLSSGVIDQVVVDTDSEEIAEVASRNFPVKILMRPERLHGDMVTINPLIEFELSETPGEIFLQTHATNPLLTPQTIRRAVECFLESPDNDSLFSVTPVQSRFFFEDGRPINHDPEVLIRTQDLPPIYEENSCIYVFTRTAFEARRNRIGARPRLFPMDRLEAVDIDTEFDFKLADFLMTQRLAAGAAGA